MGVKLDWITRLTSMPGVDDGEPLEFDMRLRAAGVVGELIDAGLPVPRLYPTWEGGVQAEWTVGTWEVSVTIDRHSLDAHALECVGGGEVAGIFHIMDADRVADLLRPVLCG